MLETLANEYYFQEYVETDLGHRCGKTFAGWQKNRAQRTTTRRVESLDASIAAFAYEEGGQMISGEVQMQALPDRTPNKQCWMLFKVANLDRLHALQSGLLYMNSVDYFAKLKGETAAALRRDELEKVYLKLSSGVRGGVVSELALQIEGQAEIVLSPETIITLHLPRPETVMVYCMGSVSAGHDGQIWGLNNGVLLFSERFREFGTHVLRITDHAEFSREGL
ncbi:hypothetical protein, partial [Pseudomonas amygdali]